MGLSRYTNNTNNGSSCERWVLQKQDNRRSAEYPCVGWLGCHIGHQHSQCFLLFRVPLATSWITVPTACGKWGVVSFSTICCWIIRTLDGQNIVDLGLFENLAPWNLVVDHHVPIRFARNQPVWGAVLTWDWFPNYSVSKCFNAWGSGAMGILYQSLSSSCPRLDQLTWAMGIYGDESIPMEIYQTISGANEHQAFDP